MANMKLQSAMEYLMTYGWAILIIAVVMVALFSLGILGGNPLGTSCLAQSGYICQNPLLHSTTFNAVLGQATGNAWVGVNLIWVPQGVTVPAAGAFCPASASNTVAAGLSCVSVGNLNTGQTTSATFVFSSAANTGTTYSGTVWAMYQIGSSGTWYEAQLATVTLKAV